MDTARRGASQRSRSDRAMSGSDWACATRARISGPAAVSRNSRISAAICQVSASCAEAPSGMASVPATRSRKPSRATAPRDGHHL